MDKIKINLAQIELHRQDYERYKRDLFILEDTKTQLNNNNLITEIDQAINFCKFNMELSLDCIFDQIKKIESKHDNKNDR